MALSNPSRPEPRPGQVLWNPPSAMITDNVPYGGCSVNLGPTGRTTVTCSRVPSQPSAEWETSLHCFQQVRLWNCFTVTLACLDHYNHLSSLVQLDCLHADFTEPITSFCNHCFHFCPALFLQTVWILRTGTVSYKFSFGSCSVHVLKWMNGRTHE